jgi:hypothetical protein
MMSCIWNDSESFHVHDIIILSCPLTRPFAIIMDAQIPAGLHSTGNLEPVLGVHSLYPLFKVDSHPQVDSVTLSEFPRTILIALIDTDSKAMENYKRRATALKAPYGTDTEVVAIGGLSIYLGQ